MGPRIRTLKSTTFFGKGPARRTIAQIQAAVQLLPKNSRRELARTTCEHPGLALAWRPLPGADGPAEIGAAGAGRRGARVFEKPPAYRSPIGQYMRHFVVDGSGRWLGCPVFEASGELACRARWPAPATPLPPGLTIRRGWRPAFAGLTRRCRSTSPRQPTRTSESPRSATSPRRCRVFPQTDGCAPPGGFVCSDSQ